MTNKELKLEENRYLCFSIGNNHSAEIKQRKIISGIADEEMRIEENTFLLAQYAAVSKFAIGYG